MGGEAIGATDAPRGRQAAAAPIADDGLDRGGFSGGVARLAARLAGTPDYHSQRHQKPAPYLWTAALGDITELLQAERPSQIYVTDGGADTHKDHRAAFDLVRAAAAAVDFRGGFYTYVNHAGDQWPWPAGPNPVAPFEAHVVYGKRVPENIAWPPDERRPITQEEAAAKLKAIRAYPLEIRLEKSYFESFVKSEEIFWRKRIRDK